MLDNDYSLPISFAMAAKIGLEETVLLSYLKQQAYLVNGKSLAVDINQLSRQLPFWTAPQLLRLLDNLQIIQLVSFQRRGQALQIQLSPLDKEDVKNTPSAGHNTAGMEDPIMAKVDRLQRESRAPSPAPSQQVRPVSERAPDIRQSIRQDYAPALPSVNDRRGVTDFDLYLEQKERSRQPDQWLPEEATLEQITQAGITREFAVSLQTEFLLRIKEQRKNVRTWNSEFFKYVKRQWQYKQSDRSSYEGTSVSSKFGKTSREQVSDALTNIHDTDW